MGNTKLGTVLFHMTKIIDLSYPLQLLAQFEHLQSITLGDAISFTERRRGIRLETAIEFLELTRSRSSLKELHLYDVSQRRNRDSAVDPFASSFVTGRDVQSPLKLEKFTFTSTHPDFYDRPLFIRLDTLDTTRLTDVRLGKALIEPQELTSLIGRASDLRQIELSFVQCDDNCNGPRLDANKKLLAALASLENLTTLKFGSVDFKSSQCICMHFQPEFIDMLKAIGRRGKLRKLALDECFIRSSTIDMNEIFVTICTYVSHLRSIKIHVHKISDGNMTNIARLAELEEIYFTGTFYRVMVNTMKDIAQLPRLERLAIDGFGDDGDSFKYLADSTMLTDLRISDARSVSADDFEKWSNGFASNLEILMLGMVGFDNSDDVEGLCRLLEKATKLRVLILRGCVTNQLLTVIAKSCPELEIFGVRPSWYWNFNGMDLQQIVDHCPKLKKLGEFGDEIWNQLQFPTYRKIDRADANFTDYDFDDGEYD